jgi:type IV pilus assembly protein PilE
MKIQLQKAKGFTIIELLIVMGIVAILAAVAVPNYRKYVLQGFRTEGRNMLLDVAARQERFRYNGPYATNISKLGLPTPYESENKKYRLEMVATDLTYTLTAIPQRNQEQDACGFLTLDNLQQKTSQKVAPKCWAE